MSSITYTPPEVGALTIELLNDIKSQRGSGLQTGIPRLDDILLPMRGAELISVIGYTSWYKSGFMNALARYATKQCLEDECVVKVTWEQSVEEDTISWIANDTGISISQLAKGDYDDQWNMIMSSYRKRIKTPLWIVGHSSKKSEEAQRSRPRITMTDVTKACDYIAHGATDTDYKIRMMVLDYLQRIRPDPQDGSSKREQMVEAVNKAKDLSIAFGCPVLLGVQAGRQVLDRAYKLPRLDDGQETSNIEQSSDKVISLWYPIKTEEEGALINGIPVSENLLICGILKQKMGIAPVTIELHIDPKKNVISAYTKE